MIRPGPALRGIANCVNAPETVIRPIVASLKSVNQIAPSGPVVIYHGVPVKSNSVIIQVEVIIQI